MNNLEIIQTAIRVAAQHPDDVRGVFLLVRDLLDVQDNTTAEQLLVSLFDVMAPKSAPAPKVVIERKPAFGEDRITVKPAPKVPLTDSTKQALKARAARLDAVKSMTARSYDAMMKVECPACLAGPGMHCITAGGTLRYDDVHSARHRAFTEWIATEGQKYASKLSQQKARTAKRKPKRLRAIDVRCPTCNSLPGQPCFQMTSAGPYAKPTTELRSEGFHRARYEHAKRRVGNATT